MSLDCGSPCPRPHAGSQLLVSLTGGHHFLYDALRPHIGPTRWFGGHTGGQGAQVGGAQVSAPHRLLHGCAHARHGHRAHDSCVRVFLPGRGSAPSCAGQPTAQGPACLPGLPQWRPSMLRRVGAQTAPTSSLAPPTATCTFGRCVGWAGDPGKELQRSAAWFAWRHLGRGLQQGPPARCVCKHKALGWEEGRQGPLRACCQALLLRSCHTPHPPTQTTPPGCMQVDAPDGATPYVLAGHQGEVTAVAWCPADFHQARRDPGAGWRAPGCMHLVSTQDPCQISTCFLSRSRIVLAAASPSRQHAGLESPSQLLPRRLPPPPTTPHSRSGTSSGGSRRSRQTTARRATPGSTPGSSSSRWQQRPRQPQPMTVWGRCPARGRPLLPTCHTHRRRQSLLAV